MKTIEAVKTKLLIFSLVFFLVALMASIGGYKWLEFEKHENIILMWVWYWGWISATAFLLSSYFYKSSSIGVTLTSDDFIFTKNGTEIEKTKLYNLMVSNNFIFTGNYLIQYKFGGEHDLFAGTDLNNVIETIKKEGQVVENAQIFKNLLSRKNIKTIFFAIWAVIGIGCLLTVGFYGP